MSSKKLFSQWMRLFEASQRGPRRVIFIHFDGVLSSPQLACPIYGIASPFCWTHTHSRVLYRRSFRSISAWQVNEGLQGLISPTRDQSQLTCSILNSGKKNTPCRANILDISTKQTPVSWSSFPTSSEPNPISLAPLVVKFAYLAVIYFFGEVHCWQFASVEE